MFHADHVTDRAVYEFEPNYAVRMIVGSTSQLAETVATGPDTSWDSDACAVLDLLTTPTCRDFHAR